jgi:hypothetical protein
MLAAMQINSTSWRRSVLSAVAVIALSVPAVAQTAPAKAAAAPALTSGQASGTFSVRGQVYHLAYAAAFVDDKDATKPIVLLLTDTAVPADVLSGATTIGESQHAVKKSFSGVVLWLDKDRSILRAEYYEKDDAFPTSTSGLFAATFDGPAGKTLIGSAKSTGADARMSHPVKLDVRFNAALK